MISDHATAYQRDFEKFLHHTNEKKVLISEIEKYITTYNIKSLLDIGAGNGDISIPLSRTVSRYLAIEKNPAFAASLRQCGLEVIEAEYPIELDESFDMVLASHTISYRTADFPIYIKQFIQEAWSRLHSQGIFLMINSSGDTDDWHALMNKIGEVTELQPNKEGYQQTVQQLQHLGEIKIKKIRTEVATETIEDMIDSLTFIAAKGDPARKERFLQHRTMIEKILMEDYATATGFAFPFYHYFHSIQKISH